MVNIAFTKGLLEPVMSDRVNYINARLKAKESGIGITTKNICDHYNNYSNLITIKITDNKGNIFTLSGTISTKGEGKIVEVLGYEVDVKPTDYMLFLQNKDVPGVIGQVGTFIGNENINVATMQVGRKLKGDKALMILNIDDRIDKKALDKFVSIDNIIWAKVIEL